MRVLVERLWPRGVSKQAASIDRWLKEISPSTELRRWYGHRRERWADFEARYHAELDANPAAVRTLESLAANGALTLVFAARDVEHSGAAALKRYLLGR